MGSGFQLPLVRETVESNDLSLAAGGERIAIRRIRDEDEYRQMLECYNDLSQRSALDHDEQAAIDERLEEFRRHGMWTKKQAVLAITDAEDQVIGMISFVRTSNLECDIGYRILRTAWRGQGIMAEALPLFCRFLFGRFSELTRLQIRTAGDNLPSRRLAEKCGFVQECELRDAYQYRGKRCDWVVYGLLRSEIEEDDHSSDVIL